MNYITEQIISSVSMRDIAEQYGLDVTRKGVMMCPFHKEKTASLKLYPENRGWYCFGCGAGGSIIDFVRRYFNLTFTEAVSKINNDFGLGLLKNDYRSKEKNYRAMENHLKKQKEKADRQMLYEQRYQELVLAFKIYRDIVRTQRPKSPSETPTKLFLNALAQIDYLEDWFSKNRTLEEWEANNC